VRRAVATASRSLFHSVFAFEALHPAGGIDQALLAGVKRMAPGANLNVQCGESRAGLEGVTTGASDYAAAILWVNLGFHRINYDFILA
jgi:hypothetical protein